MVAATARFVSCTHSARTRNHVSLARAQLGFQRRTDFWSLGEWISGVPHFSDVGHPCGDVAERIRMTEDVELVVVYRMKNALRYHRRGDFSGAYGLIALRLRDQLRERWAAIVFQIGGAIAVRF